MDTHPGNKQCDYTVCLSKDLMLKGNWSVSLSQITYPKPYDDIIPDTYVHWIFVENGDPDPFSGDNKFHDAFFQLDTYPLDDKLKKYMLKNVVEWPKWPPEIKIKKNPPTFITKQGCFLFKSRKFVDMFELGDALSEEIRNSVLEKYPVETDGKRRFNIVYKRELARGFDCVSTHGVILLFLRDNPLLAKLLRMIYREVNFESFDLCERDLSAQLVGAYRPPKFYYLVDSFSAVRSDLPIPPPFDVKSNLLYLYTDFIECQHVGNVMAPLLSCIRLNNKGEGGSHSPSIRIPKRVTKSSIKTIRMLLLNDKGELFQFDDTKSPVVCQLHFKKQTEVIYKAVENISNAETSKEEHEWCEY
jgi:hypothetical protein